LLLGVSSYVLAEEKTGVPHFSRFREVGRRAADTRVGPLITA
jgi:hypothetical protein